MTTFKKHLNLRKFGIFLLGIFCLIRGAAYLPFNSIVIEDLPSGLKLITEYMPLEAWAGVWLTIGFIAIVKAFKKEEGIAIPLVVGIMLGWGFFYIMGFVYDLTVIGEYTRSWMTASAYIIPAIVIGIFSAEGGDGIELGNITKINH